MKEPFIHQSAFVASSALIGLGTKIWHFAQVREQAVIGEDCILGTGVYVGERVQIGSRVKIENGASIFEGVRLDDGVFIGPHACLTNDRFPRAINADGTIKGASDWKIDATRVREGASIGAGAITVAGITIGRWAMVGAGSIVTTSVPDYSIAVGNPARMVGFACICGRRLVEDLPKQLLCEHCGSRFRQEGPDLIRV